MSRGHLRKRGEKYYAVIFIGTLPNGKKQYKWYPASESKKESEKFLTLKLNELNNETLILNDKITMADFLNLWYNEYCIKQLKKSTYESYRRNIDKYIITNIGNIKISKLKPLDLQKFYDSLESKLSKSSISYIHRILHKALNQAMKWEYVVKNVADLVDSPKRDNYVATILNEYEVQFLLSETKNTEIYIPILIAVGTGLRRGEILALTWNDIDFENKTLIVNKELIRTKNELSVTTPKTQKSNRIISLSNTIIEELKKLQYNQKIQKQFLKDSYNDNNLVVCNYQGNYYSPDRLNHLFKKQIKKLNLPDIRFHDLRHTHASLLLKEKVPAKVISDRLGHSTISITMNLYSHIYDSTNIEVAENFDKYLKAN